MKFVNVKVLVLLSAFFTYAASAGFFPVNRGMVNQTTVTTASLSLTTLVATSNQAHIVEGSFAHGLRLPDATTLPLDWWYNITNNSTGDLTVQNASGTTLLTLAEGRVAHLTLTARSNAAGTWKISSMASVADLADYYLKSEHVSTSDGASDAGKPIVLNGAGQIDASMLPLSGSAWSLLGNAGLDAGTNFLGTTDAVDLVFKANNAEVMRLTSAGLIDTGFGAGVVKSDASGGLSSSAVDLAADVTGVLPLAGGGTNKNMTAVDGAVVFTDADSQEVSATVSIVEADGVVKAAEFMGSDGADGDLFVTSNSDYDGNIFLDEAVRVDGGNKRTMFGTTGVPTHRMHLRATADDYLHGFALENTFSSNANAKWVIFPEHTGPLVFLNPNNSLTALQLHHFGNVGLSGASFNTGRAVNIRNPTGETGDVTLALTARASQTEDLIAGYASDDSTKVFRVTVAGAAQISGLTVSSFTAGLGLFNGSGVASSLACVTSGHVPTWNGSTFACAAPGAAAPAVNTYTANQTLTTANEVIYCNVATSDMVVTLYSAADSARKGLDFKNLSQTGTCTIRPSSTSQAIWYATGNEAELILAPGGTAVKLIPNGSTTWFVH